MMDERTKYQTIWTHDEYRQISPAEVIIGEIYAALPGQGTLIDFGCGTGRATLQLNQTGRFNVVGVDIAYNALDEAAQGAFPFVVSAIEELPRGLLRADFGVCVDVLEHLPRDRLGMAVHRMASCVDGVCFIRVANFPESHGGQFIGEPLHLSLMGAEEWHSALYWHFRKVERIWLDADEAPERYTFICRS